MCFGFLYNFCLKHFSLQEEFSEILSQICLHVKYPILLTDFKHEFSPHIFGKKKVQISSFIKIPSSGSRVFPCGQTGMKLLIAFRKFANASKNGGCEYYKILTSTISCRTVPLKHSYRQLGNRRPKTTDSLFKLLPFRFVPFGSVPFRSVPFRKNEKCLQICSSLESDPSCSLHLLFWRERL
jgi:hypothetical protein